MMESRCGILCSECAYREQMGCAGCVQIQKPFWGGELSTKVLLRGEKAGTLRRM